MANLYSISELAFRQLFPNPSDETMLSKEDFMETALTEYAWQMLQLAWAEKRNNGEYIIPSYLLREAELTVKDNEADISDLKILKALPSEMWLSNIGGFNCECEYIKSTVNQSQLMCNDDALGDNAKTYFILGKKIKFPDGTHADKLPIIYANNGLDLDSKEVEVDDAVAGLVRTRLIEIYGGKIGIEDKTNNSNGGA